VYRWLDEAGDLAAAGDLATAATLFDRAADAAPGDPQVAFWHGLTLAGVGRPDEARERLEQARMANQRFAEYLRRCAAAGLFPDIPELLDALMPVEAR